MRGSTPFWTALSISDTVFGNKEDTTWYHVVNFYLHWANAALVYALVYLLFARATQAWQAWALFAVYGLYFGLVEGTEKALVADLVPAGRRGVAYGWYNLAIGIGALPASVVFGLLWDRYGSAPAFTFGAGVAGLAAVGLLMVPLGQRRIESGQPES